MVSFQRSQKLCYCRFNDFTLGNWDWYLCLLALDFLFPWRDVMWFLPVKIIFLQENACPCCVCINPSVLAELVHVFAVSRALVARSRDRPECLSRQLWRKLSVMKDQDLQDTQKSAYLSERACCRLNFLQERFSTGLLFGFSVHWLKGRAATKCVFGVWSLFLFFF